jgi:hypothetical protein
MCRCKSKGGLAEGCGVQEIHVSTLLVFIRCSHCCNERGVIEAGRGSFGLAVLGGLKCKWRNDSLAALVAALINWLSGSNRCQLTSWGSRRRMCITAP